MVVGLKFENRTKQFLISAGLVQVSQILKTCKCWGNLDKCTMKAYLQSRTAALVLPDDQLLLPDVLLLMSDYPLPLSDYPLVPCDYSLPLIYDLINTTA